MLRFIALCATIARMNVLTGCHTSGAVHVRKCDIVVATVKNWIGKQDILICVFYCADFNRSDVSKHDVKCACNCTLLVSGVWPSQNTRASILLQTIVLLCKRLHGEGRFASRGARWSAWGRWQTMGVRYKQGGRVLHTRRELLKFRESVQETFVVDKICLSTLTAIVELSLAVI